MSGIVAIGGLPQNQKEKDEAAARAAIIAAVQQAGATGIDIAPLLMGLSQTLTKDQQKYTHRGNVLMLCHPPYDALTITKGKTVRLKGVSPSTKEAI